MGAGREVIVLEVFYRLGEFRRRALRGILNEPNLFVWVIKLGSRLLSPHLSPRQCKHSAHHVIWGKGKYSLFLLRRVLDPNFNTMFRLEVPNKAGIP